MENVDKAITFLSYMRRVGVQLLSMKNIKYFHLIFKGYTPNKGHYFDFKKYGYDSYVKDTTRYLRTVFYNYYDRDMMDDKYACYLFLKEHSKRPVPVYGLIQDGAFYSPRPGYSEKIFRPGSKWVLKPRKGRGGEGIKVLEAKDNGFLLGGKEFATFQDCCKGLKNYVVNPYVQQHQYSASIYPQSLNTIRVLTGILDGEVLLIKAGHRFGVERTGPVDNFSQGGIFANINLETGIIENPMIWSQKKHKTVKVDRHPGTRVLITGTSVPNWTAIIKEILELHRSINFIKYVGWDLAITPDGFAIVEANYASDLIGLQLDKPLLLDKEHKRFFSKN